MASLWAITSELSETSGKPRASKERLRQPKRSCSSCVTRIKVSANKA